ncbi:hypothetical protein N7481_009526 [Penicillium waksmanii]|uniref:uncharacterized protein n=1 Tax=Penicillium waksmanii TaxID=69791 RepID=UPI002548E2BD|nr:uncharacterized protein N7481_009526 [Penicillium waksmanii]KAJ5975819.1 hypothetical protein N7481_009526 [Penicillium waksmanii]
MAAPHHPLGQVVPIPNPIPSSTDRQAIVERYRDLRLHGLKVDPEAFTSLYEDEVKFPYKTWQSRVENSIAKTLVAIDPETDQREQIEDKTYVERFGSNYATQRLLRQEWLGIATIIGPVRFEGQSDDAMVTSVKSQLHTAFIKDGQYQIPDPSTVENDDLSDAHAVFLIVGLFILPQARRRGLAGRLVEASINSIREEARRKKVSKASISIQVAPKNLAAQGLYKKMGFHVSEKAIVMNSRPGGEERVIGLEMEVNLGSES